MNKIVKLSGKDRTRFLQSEILGVLDDDAARSVMETATLLTLPARHMLFTEAQTAQHLYYVLSGYVRLFRTGKDGREADVRICGPGEVFNDCMIFDTDAIGYSAQTAECTTLAQLELSQIRAMVEADLATARAVIRSLSRSTLTMMDCVANDRLQTAPQRLAHYLMTQAEPDGSSYSLRLPFQKSVLAGKLGLAPEALSRAFSTLKSCGVSVRGRVIHIHDANALSRV